MLFRSRSDEIVSNRTPARPDPALWPITNTPPNRDSLVTVVIWGLAGIWYNNRKPAEPFLEVGFHSGHPQHPHSLQVRIYEDCVAGSPVNLPASLPTMKLMAVGGGPPNVFQTTESPFDRMAAPDPTHDMDLRWMPDLESFPFYSDVLPKNKYPGPRLRLLNGTLYTRVKTNNRFCLIDVDQPSNCVDYGPIALYMAAAIEGSSASLQINSQTPIALNKPGVKYQIVFRNMCDSCTHDQNGPAETDWNDFHYNRKILIVPNNRTKVGLKVKQPTVPGAEADFCTGGFPPLSDERKRANDEAPCSADGYGHTSGS